MLQVRIEPISALLLKAWYNTSTQSCGVESGELVQLLPIYIVLKYKSHEFCVLRQGAKLAIDIALIFSNAGYALNRAFGPMNFDAALTIYVICLTMIDLLEYLQARKRSRKGVFKDIVDDVLKGVGLAEPWCLFFMYCISMMISQNTWFALKSLHMAARNQATGVEEDGTMGSTGSE